jgi:hypothetical protein
MRFTKALEAISWFSIVICGILLLWLVAGELLELLLPKVNTL